MIKSRISFNGRKRVIAITAATAVSLLVASIAAIGAAPLSDQQTSSSLRIGRGVITSALIADETIVSADLKDGAAVRSSDIVDGQVNTADLANDAVTSDKIKNGEVKAEDLDPSIEIGGGGSSDFSLQVTERSNAMTLDEATQAGQDGQHVTVTVQCNSDEIVTGGGFGTDPNSFGAVGGDAIIISKKHDNGWSATWERHFSDIPNVVYAECLKVVNE